MQDNGIANGDVGEACSWTRVADKKISGFGKAKSVTTPKSRMSVIMGCQKLERRRMQGRLNHKAS
jgi:hypothetical protein